MLLGVVAQAQNFAITATTEASIRKNIVKGNAANYGLGVINDTLKLVGLTTRNVIFTGSTSKTDIGLGNVDNTSDANKPVSTATLTALNLKANLASPTFTGTVSGITKTMVGLGNVDNTSDASKPISTATQTALDLKANLASPSFTGTVSGVTKSMVGLGNVDNTNDAAKPISTATQTALDLKLTSTTAASTYLPISNPTATGTLTAPTISNTLGANFATTSGNVGIGTTSPSYKLDVNGSFKTTSTTDLAVGGGNISMGTLAGTNVVGVEIGTLRTGTGISYIDLGGESTNADYGLRIWRDGFNSKFEHMGTGDFLLNSFNVANMRFATQNAERMRISSSGNVGINTTTDAGFKLDVSGTARVTSTATFSASVGIGTTSPAATALLDITSTTQGVLFPRLTTTQINAITSPANGLTVYNTTLLALCFYDGTGWRKVSHSTM
jgi:hypothetical protein